jgi:hypothetical protein
MKENGINGCECLPNSGLISFAKLADYLQIGPRILERALKKQGVPVFKASGYRRHSLVNLSDLKMSK